MANKDTVSTSVSLTEENRRWLDDYTDNRSSFINDLIEDFRNFGNSTHNAVIHQQIVELEHKQEMHEDMANATDDILDDLRDNIHTEEDIWRETYEEAYNILHEKVALHPPDLDAEPDYQHALEYWAGELDMEPAELEGQIRDDLKTD